MYFKRMKVPAVVTKRPDFLKKVWKKALFLIRMKGGADAGWKSGRDEMRR